VRSLATSFGKWQITPFSLSAFGEEGLASELSVCGDEAEARTDAEEEVKEESEEGGELLDWDARPMDEGEAGEWGEEEEDDAR